MSSLPHHSESQLVLPRGLIFCAALWLAASVALAMGFRAPVHATAATLEPGIRLMLQSVVIGLMIGWPLLRLSQRPTLFPAQQTLLDLVALVTLLQVIVWVPRVFTVWAVSRTAAIDAMLVAWTALAGAIVASAIGTDRPLVRIAAMIACVAIVMFGPVVVWLNVPWMSERSAAVLIAIGPFLGIPYLAEGGATRPSPAQWHGILVIAFAAAMCWGWLGVLNVVRRWTVKDRL